MDSNSPTHLRALTLSEALTQLHDHAHPLSLPPDPALTEKWLASCSKGDLTKFSARLAWEGLTLEDVPRLATMPELDSPPSWRPLLEKALSHFENHQPLPEATRRVHDEARQGVPFTEFWDAFAMAALETLPLAAQTPEVAWFLSRRLAPLGAPLCYADFDTYRTTHAGDGDAYSAWIQKGRQGGARQFFQTYPMLARGLASITLTAASTLTDLLDRLAADRLALEESFGSLGTLTKIDPGLSDRHYHGRQVARIHFSSGLILIYKPKSVDLDAAFQGLLQKMHQWGDIPLPAPLKILRRDGYGWVEHVDHFDFTQRQDVEHYFRQGGGLLALVYALEGRDFIMDNIIATRRGPVAIDAEAALQPLCMPGGAERMDRATLLPQLLKGRDFSVLDTGLLPLWMPGGSGCYDMSGLGGQTGYVSALQQEQWEGVGTAAMTCIKRPVAVEPEKNRVNYLGDPQSAASYAGQIDAGFTQVFQLIMSRRSELLAEIESWKTCQVRFLLRPTNTYGQVLKRMLSGAPLRSGLLAGIEAEILYRPFITSNIPPPIADFLKEETGALQRWDIPCFHLSAGEDAHHYFLASPLLMAKDRISRLDEADLAKQRRVILTALTLKPRPELGATGVPHDPFPDLTLARQQKDPDWKMPEASLVYQAEAIADILRQPPAASSGAGKVLLFDGTVGPSIFLAALGRITGREEYHEQATRLMEEWLMDAYSHEFKSISQTTPVGAAEGLASLPYSCWVLSRLLDRPDLLERAAELAGTISREQILKDSQLDLYSGAAGAAMVFSALAEATGDSGVFKERAAWAEERLLSCAIYPEDGNGVYWEACGEKYLGYGHGAAGIASALLRSSMITGNTEASRLAEQCLHWIAGMEKTGQGWPHLLRNGEPLYQKMESLCHGTPGVAIAYAEAGKTGTFGNSDIMERLRRRLTSLEAHPIDTLCCGNAGRLDALGAAGTSPSVTAELLLTMLKRREPLGLFRTDFRRSDIYTCRPGFYKGLSGIGYHLLRLSHPGILPAITAWR